MERISAPEADKKAALAALDAPPEAFVWVAHFGITPVGAASYRLAGAQVEHLRLGVLAPGHHVGQSLMRQIAADHQDKVHYRDCPEECAAFFRSVGMRRTRETETGMLYVWTVNDVRNFLGI